MAVIVAVPMAVGMAVHERPVSVAVFMDQIYRLEKILIRQDLFHRPFARDAVVLAQHQQPIRQMWEKDHVVRGRDERQPRLRQLAEKVHESGLIARVQSRRRLVQQ